MAHFRAWPVGLVLSFLATISLSGQEIYACDKPKDKTPIESFRIVFPSTFQRTYSATVETFVAAGFIPNMNAPISNQIEWTSADQSSEYEYWKKVRTIRAVLFSVEGGTTVNISAHEESTKGNRSLSNKNKGYGFKVWCATRALSDSLAAFAARLRTTVCSVQEYSERGPASGSSSGPTVPRGVRSIGGWWYGTTGGRGDRERGICSRELMPTVGRIFEAADFSLTSDQAVLLSDHLWRERYKGLPAIVGMTVELGGQRSATSSEYSPPHSTHRAVSTYGWLCETRRRFCWVRTYYMLSEHLMAYRRCRCFLKQYE